MGKLTALDVERTDAVDRPATGHRWMIVKSEGENGSTPDTAELAKAALDLIAKGELELPEDVAKALAALAEALGVEFQATAKDADEGDEADGDEAEGDDEVDGSESDDSTDDSADGEVEKEPTVDDRLARIEESIAALAEGRVEKVNRLPGKSKQREADQAEEPVQKGTGLFTNIVFGQGK